MLGVLVVVVIIAVIGFYLVTHSGGSTTVKNPNVNAPHVDFWHYVDNAAQFVATKTGGTLVATVAIAILVVTLYRNMGKGQVFMLTLIGVMIAISAGALVQR
jgi:hypothetical protein